MIFHQGLSCSRGQNYIFPYLTPRPQQQVQPKEPFGSGFSAGIQKAPIRSALFSFIGEKNILQRRQKNLLNSHPNICQHQFVILRKILGSRTYFSSGTYLLPMVGRDKQTEILKKNSLFFWQISFFSISLLFDVWYAHPLLPPLQKGLK